MTKEELSKLTDEQLLAADKSMKSTNIMNAVLIGLMIGIAVYSTIKNGFGFFTFFPLIFVFVLVKNSVKKKELDEFLKERNLK